MTDDIERLKALEAAATKGPWKLDELDKNGQTVALKGHLSI